MIENVLLECPFCRKKTISAVHYPSILQTKTSHAAGRSVTKYYYTKDKYEIASGCSNCGRSKKEIRRVMNEGGPGRKEKQKKRLEELRKQGFPMRLTSKS